jgi:hypothetical protein
MLVRRATLAIAAAALVSAAAGSAWAGDRPSKPVDFTVKSEPLALVPNSGQAVRVDASHGRFGFTVSVDQPGARPATANDVSAGAFYRITPSLRVGGSVALGAQDLTPRATTLAHPADTPKVRLETRFKF